MHSHFMQLLYVDTAENFNRVGAPSCRAPVLVAQNIKISKKKKIIQHFYPEFVYLLEIVGIFYLFFTTPQPRF